MPTTAQTEDQAAKQKPFDNEGGCLKKKTKDYVWKFVHHEDYEYQTSILDGRQCSFNWLEIATDGTITVKGSRNNNRGYAWDGCTPKLNRAHITWGNFDGKLIKHQNGSYKPYTYYASMIHDILYQYKRCAPVSRKEADRIFYKMLKESGFMWSRFYWVGVRSFGWIYKGWGKKAAQKSRNDA